MEKRYSVVVFLKKSHIENWSGVRSLMFKQRASHIVKKCTTRSYNPFPLSPFLALRVSPQDLPPPPPDPFTPYPVAEKKIQNPPFTEEHLNCEQLLSPPPEE